MRKYINKGLIIILLILANLFLPINREEPNYEESKVKKRFILAKDKNDSQLKKAKKMILQNMMLMRKPLAKMKSLIRS